MCGICGFIYFDGMPADPSLISHMSESIRHRGPDDAGAYTDGNVTLGHRRLSIIDLSGGRQPLSNEDGSVWIVFNGEIYNYQDLNAELKSSHHIRTRSDTETIVHLYEEHPESFVTRLRGMFAFALWDQNKRTLILGRDRVGKKPLYYYLDDQKLVFASEIKAILRHPDLSLEIDEQAVSDYISFGYVPAPKSIFRRIRKVNAGHFLQITGRGVKDVHYWDLSFSELQSRSEEEWRHQLLEELSTATRIRLMSEVPLGAFLSGGLDSSAVVATMSRLMDQPVKTSTIAFNEGRFDESKWALQVADHLGTDHNVRTVTPSRVDVLEKLALHYDEPFGDSSALPTFLVCQAARERVTVALSGDGGDENFAGYRRYLFDLQENRLRALLPQWVRSCLFRPLSVIYPKLDWAPRFLRGRATFESLARNPLEGYFETISIFRTAEKSSILAADLKARLRGYESIDVFRHHYDRADTVDPLSRIQYLDIKTYLTEDILTKVDRASMAHSLEVRCPLLDHKFMEFAATVPSSLKLKGRCRKYIFKSALRQVLPQEIIDREKMGFALPLAEWFRGGIKDFAHAYLLESEDPFISSASVRRLWEQHQSRRRDRSSQLWNILMFRLWLRTYSRPLLAGSSARPPA